VRYSAARTVVPLTMPAHASMLTGLYPPRHTVRTNSRTALPASAATLAEACAERGIETAAFVASAVLARDFGLDQGFELYDDVERPELGVELRYDERSADAVAERVLSWLAERDPSRPFFAWVHFFDPHLPHEPLPRFLVQAGGNPYHAEVARVDDAIGRILAALRAQGLDQELVIAVVADHGEAQEEHGEGTHGMLAYESTLRVPLILCDPGGWRAGETSSELASVVDIFPTLAEALGLRSAPGIDGLSLFRRRVPAERGVYFESLQGLLGFGQSQLVGWADAKGKYLHSSRPELYDVAADPKEQENLLPERAADVPRYQRAIRELSKRPVLERAAEDRASAELVDQLRRLGYAGLGSADAELDPLATSLAPSPADAIGDHRAFLRAVDLHGLGRTPEAIAILEDLVARNPANAIAWAQLSTCYVKSGRFAETLTAARMALELGEDWAGPHENLGVAFDNLGRLSEAVAEYARVLEQKPAHDQVRDRLVLLLEQLGRTEEARGYRR
jgi:tetratricopeptide (TPR) repeat protein